MTNDQYDMALQTMRRVPAQTRRVLRNANVQSAMILSLQEGASEGSIRLDLALLRALGTVAEAVRDSAAVAAQQSLVITDFLDRPDLWERLNGEREPKG